MTGPKIIFFVLAAAIIVFSVMSIFSRRILRAAVFLLFVLVAMAGLYYMMNFQLLAAVQLMLYAGGIVVLIIFSILLTSQINSKLEPPRPSHLFSGAMTSLVGIALTTLVILQYQFETGAKPSIGTDMRTIGLQLLGTGVQGYALPFEVISVLLLAALVGSIFIARKDTI
jgi:NADH-quinone oxidoreductase subunit J